MNKKEQNKTRRTRSVIQKAKRKVLDNPELKHYWAYDIITTAINQFEQELIKETKRNAWWQEDIEHYITLKQLIGDLRESKT